MKKHINNNLLIVLLSCLLWTVAQAAKPMWTIVPAPGSNPTQSVFENGAANVLYAVQNQSDKPKTLMMQPLPGITQISPVS